MKIKKGRRLLQQLADKERSPLVMHHKNYTTYRPLTKALSLILVAVALFAGYAIGTEINRVHAESVYATEYILCRTYTNIRMWPSRSATEIGRLDPGDTVEIDGRTKDGWAHIVAPCDGWVHAGYLSASEPRKVDQTGVVVARNRVAARRWIDGPQVDEKPWLINGSEVTIYWMSDDWACTSRGFIQSEWLEVCSE